MFKIDQKTNEDWIDRHDLNFTTRNFHIRAESVNEKARTVEGILTTENPTIVFDWRKMEPIVEMLVVDGVRFDGSQVPLLNNHSRWDLDDVIGSIRDIRVEGKAVIGRLHLAADDEIANRAWNKIKQGHLTDISVGYRVIKSEELKPGESKTINGRKFTADEKSGLRVSTEWHLREGSLVPIGADSAAKIRALLGIDQAPQHSNTQGDTIMDPETTQGAPQEKTEDKTVKPREIPKTEINVIDVDKLKTDAIQEGQEQGRQAERERQNEMRKLGDGLSDELIQKAIDDGWDLNRASREFLAEFRKGRQEPVEPGAPAIHSRGSEDVNEAVLTAGLFHRTGGDYLETIKFDQHPDLPLTDERRKQHEKIAEQAWRFRDLSLVDICREVCRITGAKNPETGGQPHTRQEIVRAAVSTSVLTNILTTNVNARLQRAYQEAPDTTDWADSEDVNDFKTNERPQLGKFGSLKRLPSGGVAQHAHFEDFKEEYSIARYARQFILDEQTIIDENLGAISRFPRDLGLAAARLRPDLVYSVLLANANLQDSAALFVDATHGNLKTGALTLATLKAGITAMSKQTQDGINLNISAAYIMCPPEHEFTFREYVKSTEIILTGSTDAVRGNKNVVSDLNLKIRSDNRISAAGVTDPRDETARVGTATNWFLAANPREAPTIVVGYLAGTGRRPLLRRFALQQGQWGIGWDVKHDIGACALDYRGLLKSTGA